MSEVANAPETTLADLRRAFDQSFTKATVTSSEETVDFISIRVGGEAHAIRMAQIASLHSDVTVAPMPSPLPELLGLAGFRSTLVPVYDLAALLGYPATQGRWAVVDADRSLALVFDDFDDHFRIDNSAIVPHRAGNASAVHEIARQADRAWPIIDIPSLVSALRKRLPRDAANKE